MGNQAGNGSEEREGEIEDNEGGKMNNEIINCTNRRLCCNCENFQRPEKLKFMCKLNGKEIRPDGVCEKFQDSKMIERIRNNQCPVCGTKLITISKYEFYCPKCHPNKDIIIGKLEAGK